MTKSSSHFKECVEIIWLPFLDSLICSCRWKIPAKEKIKRNTPVHIYREIFNHPLLRKKEVKKLFLHLLTLNQIGGPNLEWIPAWLWVYDIPLGGAHSPQKSLVLVNCPYFHWTIIEDSYDLIRSHPSGCELTFKILEPWIK